MASYKFKLISNDNLDAYLKALGHPEDQRKAAATAEVTLDITIDGNGFTEVTTHYGPQASYTYKYKVGEEFEITQINGKKIKALVTGAGVKYTTVEYHDGYEVTHIREFADDQLKQTSTAKGVTVVQVYKKI